MGSRPPAAGSRRLTDHDRGTASHEHHLLRRSPHRNTSLGGGLSTSSTPLPAVVVKMKFPSGQGIGPTPRRSKPPITFTDRFRSGLEQRRMITAPADDRWAKTLLQDADAAAAKFPLPTAPGAAPDPKRLAVFADALEVFAARQSRSFAQVLSTIRQEYDTYLRGPRPTHLERIDRNDDSSSSASTSTSGPATVAAVRAEIAELQSRIKRLTAELAVADKEHRHSAAQLARSKAYSEGGNDWIGFDGESVEEREDGGGGAVRNSASTSASAAEDSRGHANDRISSAVVRIGTLDAETAALNAQLSKDGVPLAVVEWLRDSLNDVTRDCRVVRKQLEVLDKGWFTEELSMLGGGGIYGAHTSGEGWFETTAFA